jgi:hypothetical protein
MESAKIKKEKVVKPKVTLISYSMKMTIPTGQYANIIPEIVVKAGTVEEAHDYIAPHMNKLWKEYFMISERKNEPAKPVVQKYPEQNIKGESPVTNMNTPVSVPPVAAVACQKASSAIASCLSNDALDLIANQITKSVKLDDKDKDKLMVELLNKRKELNGKVNPA